MFIKTQLFFSRYGLMVMFTYLLLSCNGKSSEGMLLLTQVSKDQNLNDVISYSDPVLMQGAQLIMIDPLQPNRPAEIISKDFYSACSPSISFDAKKMVFAGQKSVNDIWQIYEMDLLRSTYEPLTDSEYDCMDPVYLPGDRIIHSKILRQDSRVIQQPLFMISRKGAKEEQVSFNPGLYFGTSMLHDGRLLALYREKPSEKSDLQLMVMRPDGTKEMLFFKSSEGEKLLGRAIETKDGNIYMIEKNTQGKGKLVSVSYNNPLQTKKLISESVPEDITGVNLLKNGNLLICSNQSEEDSYGLFEYDPESGSIKKSIYKNTDYKIIEAISVEPQNVPKNIPSEVKMTEQTALLLCQDINFMGFNPDSPISEKNKAVKLEILGAESSLGLIDAESDGSVYLKIKADLPFKLQTLNADGDVVSGPSSWMNLRPNERRACVGCHAGNEIVPKNHQPLAVRKEPILIPSQTNLLAGRK